MIQITSASNEKFKYFRSLLSKKGRDESGRYIVEGIKSVNDALNSSCIIEAVILRDDMAWDKENTDFPVYCISSALAEKLSDTKTPQGVFAVIKKQAAHNTLNPRGAYVYCDRISDPGNLGTIIRTADSAGFDGVILSPGCVELYNPKTIRSCMGSFFHISVMENKAADTINEFVENGGKAYGGILSGNTKDYRLVDYSGGIIIVVGNEANGISDEIQKLCQAIKIPIYGKAESLNAAVAASIMMYEAANNRNN